VKFLNTVENSSKSHKIMSDSVKVEVKDKKSQNDRSGKTADLEIFKLLKLSYNDDFHSSPSKLREKLDEVFSSEIKRAKDGSGSLISDKTIRNFFSANEPPTASTKTLNYLCKVMLGYGSYGEAIRILKPNQVTETLPDLTAKIGGLQEEVNLSETWIDPYRSRVRERWGQIKVLDMSEALSLESIYSGTYFLKSDKGKRQLDYENSLSELILDSSPSKSNKYQQEQDERVLGLEKIKHCSKLLILGVGGSGKTLFLKYLALRYLDPQVAIDDFGIQLVSIYIHLKVWADEIVKSDLATVIVKILKEDGLDEAITDGELTSFVVRMLKNGQFLILLDAIDESSQKIEEVIRIIQDFSEKYSKNRIVITCRLETTERQFERFHEVEIASFTEQQVDNFARKWFESHGKSKLGERFIEHQKINPAIFSLTRNPLALTYLCIVFRENLGFSKDTSGIYEDVVEIFLRKWDYSRDIEDRTPVSDKLSYGRKLMLFRQLAYQGITCEPAKFMWRERELKTQIRSFIEKLSKTKEEDIDDATDLVLRVVIRDHGLLVPQSRGLYGFPHRTFQEYFTAKDVASGMNKNSSNFGEIIGKYLTKTEWENVFLMIAELLEDADDMFKLMFHHVNALVENSEALQEMLVWLHKITESFEVNSSSWRAFCLSIDLDLELYISRYMSINAKIYAQEIPVRMKDFNEERNKTVPNNPKLILALYLVIAHAFASDKGDGKSPRFEESTDYMKKVLAIKETTNVQKEIELAVAKAEGINNLAPDLITGLKDLQLSQPSEAEPQQEWKEWAKSLKQIMFAHLNVGHQVKLSKTDEKILADYLYANNLLLKCICGDSLSTRSLREKIFDHILLPIDSIPDDLKLDFPLKS
jgi:GTPase SAR1 family protein